MKRSLPFLALLLLATLGWSAAYKDFQTTPVSQEDGDTAQTVQVSCPVTGGVGNPAQLVAAVTTRTMRRRKICNTSAFRIYIGTNTTSLSTTGFVISESTGTFPCIETQNTAALFCTGVSTGTVAVLEHDSSK